MTMIFGALLVLTLAPGTLCQEIIVGPPTVLTPCTSKSRAGKDRFIFTGTIGKDVPKLIAEDWQSIMAVVAFREQPGPAVHTVSLTSDNILFNDCVAV
ncbi:hypothetical protein BsWGS_18557 [Bradybaena similaris]